MPSPLAAITTARLDRTALIALLLTPILLMHGHAIADGLIVRDQLDLLAIPAIDGAEHTLAQPRCVLHDPVEHRQEIGRRVGDQAQDF